MITQNVYIGIDVSKLRLDVHVRPCNETFDVENNLSGLMQMKDRLERWHVLAIGLEASGGYEREAASTFADAGYVVHLLEPLQVRNFARAMKIKAKTDVIDAALIARYIEAAGDVLIHHQPDAIRQEISDLSMYRRKLVEESNGLKSLLGTIKAARVRLSLAQRIAAIKAEVQALQHEIKACICASPELSALSETLMAVPGVGPILTATLIADLPELGQIGSKRISSLVGVAPHARQSGQIDRGGKCTGGRKNVRDVFYMATLSAIKAKMPHLEPFYRRLREAGKPFKKALIATVRKLLTILNAIVRDKTQFKQQTQ
jgi:transposase